MAKLLRCLSAILAGTLLPAAAAPGASSHVVHERRGAQQALWKRHSRAPAHQMLPMKVGMKQRNLEHAERFVLDVADPASPNFGKHWTAEKVARTFAPSAETSNKTVQWLVDAGIGRHRLRHSAGRNWVEFNATVGEVEALLDTEYHFFEHSGGGFHIACDQYGLPGHVREHIDFIMPTIHLDGMRPVPYLFPTGTKREPLPIYGLNGTEICPRLITIDCLRALYNFTAGRTKHAGNKLGIPEWSDYLYLPDLKVFFENFTSPPIPSDTVPEFVSIDGGRPANLSVAQSGYVIESAADFQLAYSIIWPQEPRLYQVGDSVNVDSAGTFNIFLDAIDASYCTYMGGDAPYLDPQYPDPNLDGWKGAEQCGGASLPSVMTISYGQIEGALPRFYQERQCQEWMKLALQGVSVLFASGDNGVANTYNEGDDVTCLNAEYGYVDVNGTKFSPSFPNNCPYITTVGGTQLNGSIAGGEVAAQISGGGFSDIFPVPRWQEAAVAHYLAHHAPDYGSKSVWNSSGRARAYPDVSAMAINLAVVWMNQTTPAVGTSASAPIVASLITLLNEERLEAGKGPVGFLNPTFYAHPEMFNDITSGNNPGCGTKGFSAAPGWDPVTGMGTPNYGKMRDVFLALP